MLLGNDFWVVSPWKNGPLKRKCMRNRRRSNTFGGYCVDLKSLIFDGARCHLRHLFFQLELADCTMISDWAIQQLLSGAQCVNSRVSHQNDSILYQHELDNENGCSEGCNEVASGTVDRVRQRIHIADHADFPAPGFGSFSAGHVRQRYRVAQVSVSALAAVAMTVAFLHLQVKWVGGHQLAEGRCHEQVPAANTTLFAL